MRSFDSHNVVVLFLGVPSTVVIAKVLILDRYSAYILAMFFVGVVFWNGRREGLVIDVGCVRETG